MPIFIIITFEFLKNIRWFPILRKQYIKPSRELKNSNDNSDQDV